MADFTVPLANQDISDAIVNAHNNRIVSVKDFGATGDGVTDDTAAVQAAFDQAGTYTVMLSSGTYAVSTAINVKQDFTGAGGKLLQTTTDDILNVTIAGKTIQGLIIEGNNSIGAGIRISANNTKVLYNKITKIGDAVSSDGCGIMNREFGDLEDVLIHGNHISEGAGTSNADIGFSYYCKDLVITDNICLGGNDQGIAVNGVGTDTTEIIITGNLIKDKTRHGILALYTGSTSKSCRTLVSNNNITNCGWTGIYFQGSTGGTSDSGDCTASGNIIKYCGGGELTLTAGIYMTGTRGYICTDNIVMNSGYDDTDTARANTSAGIKLATDTKDIIVSNNKVSGTYGTGILMNGSTVKSVVVSGNIVSDSTDNEIALTTATALGVDAVQISDNILDSSTSDSHGLTMIPSGSGSYLSVVVNNNRFIGAKSTTSKRGINLNVNTTNLQGTLRIKDNHVENYDTGIHNSAYLGNRGVGTICRVQNNIIESCTLGVEFQDGSTSWMFLENCIFKDNTATGLGSYMINAELMIDNRVTYTSANHYIFGEWLVGDKWYNSAPSDGGHVGKVCLTAGTGDSVWENFGLIGESASLDVDDIAALEALTGMATGDKSFVSDQLRGGTFVYDATQSGVNDTGVVFDGWVRQFNGSLINIEWFGADDTAADNSTAAEACSVYCCDNRMTMYVPSTDTGFEFTSAMAFGDPGSDGGSDIKMDGHFIANLSNALPVNDTYYPAAITIHCNSRNIEIDVRRKTESDWVNDQLAGVSLSGRYNTITVKYIYFFYAGIFIGDYVFGWNTIYFEGFINQCCAGLLADNSKDRYYYANNESNWLNENTWYKMKVETHSGSSHYQTYERRYFAKLNGKESSFNRNFFYEPMCEEHYGEYTFWDLIQVGELHVINPRNEIFDQGFRLKSDDFVFTASTKTIASVSLSTAGTNISIGQTVRIGGSDSNDGEYIVATVVSATSFTVEETLTDEVAGADVSLYRLGSVIASIWNSDFKTYSTSGDATLGAETIEHKYDSVNLPESDERNAQTYNLEVLGLPKEYNKVFGFEMIAEYNEETNGMYPFTMRAPTALIDYLTYPMTFSNGILSKDYTPVDLQSGILIKVNDATIFEYDAVMTEDNVSRFGMQFYDVDGVLIPDADATKAFYSTSYLTENPSGYDTWTLGSDATKSYRNCIGINPAMCHYIRFVFFTKTSAYSQFNIYSNASRSRTQPEIVTIAGRTPAIPKAIKYNTAAPTSGTYRVGDKVYNTTPSAAGYEGWICVTAGTPGTWKGFGLIQT